MRNQAAASAAQAPRTGGFDPERGVFIFPEGGARPGVMPGVALIGENGRRPPKPILTEIPKTRRPQKRGWRAPRHPSALAKVLFPWRMVAWAAIGAGGAALVVLVLASAGVNAFGA